MVDDLFHRIRNNPYGLAFLQVAVLLATVAGIVGWCLTITYVMGPFGIVPTLLVAFAPFIIFSYISFVKMNKDLDF